MSKKERYPVKLECPICGHYMNFIIDKEATLKSLEDMNWKDRVKKAIRELPCELIKGEPYMPINKLLKKLEIGRYKK